MKKLKKIKEGRNASSTLRQKMMSLPQRVSSEPLELEHSEEKPPKIRLPKKLKLMLERSRMFSQSPRLVLMDKMMRKK